MATNHTTNYGLNLWEPGDDFLRAEFNENTQKLDAALKAEMDARTALAQTVSQKADAAATTAALSKKGNCTIVTGTYVGTGEYGQAHPNSLTFLGKPLLIFINSNSFGHVWVINGQQCAISHYSTNSHVELYFKWTGNSFEWYNDHSAQSQLNVQNCTFSYVALITQ